MKLQHYVFTLLVLQLTDYGYAASKTSISNNSNSNSNNNSTKVSSLTTTAKPADFKSTYPKKVSTLKKRPSKPTSLKKVADITEKFKDLPADDLAFIKELDKQFKLHGGKVKIKVENDNATIASTSAKNSKRTIDGELGYGYAHNGYDYTPPKYMFYPYSQDDIAHNAPKYYIPDGKTEVSIEPSYAYELKPQTYVTHSGHHQQQIDLSHEDGPVHHDGGQQQQYGQQYEEPVIVLRIPGPAKYASHLQTLLQQYLEIRAAQYLRILEDTEQHQHQHPHPHPHQHQHQQHLQQVEHHQHPHQHQQHLQQAEHHQHQHPHQQHLQQIEQQHHQQQQPAEDPEQVHYQHQHQIQQQQYVVESHQQQQQPEYPEIDDVYQHYKHRAQSSHAAGVHQQHQQQQQQQLYQHQQHHQQPEQPEQQVYYVPQHSVVQQQQQPHYIMSHGHGHGQEQPQFYYSHEQQYAQPEGPPANTYQHIFLISMTGGQHQTHYEPEQVHQQEQHQQLQQQPVYVPEPEHESAPQHYAVPAASTPVLNENNPRSSHTKVIFTHNSEHAGSDYTNMYPLPSIKPNERHAPKSVPDYHQDYQNQPHPYNLQQETQESAQQYQKQQEEAGSAPVEAVTQHQPQQQQQQKQLVAITQRPYNYHAHGMKPRARGRGSGHPKRRVIKDTDQDLQKINDYVRENLGAQTGTEVEYKTAKVVEG